MSSARDGLLAAILEDPDDDVPRLVYADWLEEHGDEVYARFIRKQIALAQVPEYHPLWVRHWFEDRNPITGYGFDDRCPALPDELRWAGWAFARGFPANVKVTDVADFVTNALALFAVAPVQALSVDSEYGESTPDLSTLCDSPYFARLRRMHFSLSRIPANVIRRIQNSAHSANLAELEVEFSKFDEDGIEALFRPPLITHLTRLRLHSNCISRGDLVPAIRGAGGPIGSAS
jgi:uncharacterized protein (TIGR02996 family)